jgi:hypothetical protein
MDQAALMDQPVVLDDYFVVVQVALVDQAGQVGCGGCGSKTGGITHKGSKSSN